MATVGGAHESPSPPVLDFFGNSQLWHLHEAILAYLSESDLLHVAASNKILRNVVMNQPDCVTRIALFFLQGVHLPEIPRCLRMQLFSGRASPRTAQLCRNLMIDSREAVVNRQMPEVFQSFHNRHKSSFSQNLRYCQMLDAQLSIGDFEGALMTARSMFPHGGNGHRSITRERATSIDGFRDRCPCVAYARIARAQCEAGLFDDALATIRRFEPNSEVTPIALAEVGAAIAGVNRELAQELFTEARALIKQGDHYDWIRIQRVARLLILARSERASNWESAATFSDLDAAVQEALTSKTMHDNEKIQVLIAYAQCQIGQLTAAIETLNTQGFFDPKTVVAPIIQEEVEVSADSLAAAKALFTQAREVIRENNFAYENIIRLSLLARFEEACGCTNRETLELMERQPLHQLPPFKKINALYIIALSYQEHGYHDVPLALYEQLRAVLVQPSQQLFGLITKIMSLLDNTAESALEAAAAAQHKVFVQWGQSILDRYKDDTYIDYVRPFTASYLCKVARIRKAGSTQPLATIVEMIESYPENSRWVLYDEAANAASAAGREAIAQGLLNKRRGESIEDEPESDEEASPIKVFTTTIWSAHKWKAIQRAGQAGAALLAVGMLRKFRQGHSIHYGPLNFQLHAKAHNGWQFPEDSEPS